ncbi:MAG: N-acetylmuramoyl-L-alanine amidase, partial [Gemmatimonadota bacterium]|nr:N-acetylmuramoyl-L-alanine amidase [Gemmatimonadota bacterium]
MIQYINKSIHAAAAGLLIPVWLAAASFAVENRRSGEIIKLAVHPGEQSSYLDLKELAGILGDSLYWEQPGERLVWVAGEGSFVFEDRVTFFAFKGESYQLVAPCLLHGPRFLVPLQAAVEYLPGFYPERFVYNKLNNRLVDHREKVIAAGKETIAREKETPRAALPQRSVKTDGRSYRISTVVIDPGHGGRDPGAIGRRYKLREKDLVLDISKKLAANLKKSSEL